MPCRRGVCLLASHPLVAAPCLPDCIRRHHPRKLQGVNVSIRRQWFPPGRENLFQGQRRRRISLYAIGRYGKLQPGPSHTRVKLYCVVLFFLHSFGCYILQRYPLYFHSFTLFLMFYSPSLICSPSFSSCHSCFTLLGKIYL